MKFVHDDADFAGLLQLAATWRSIAITEKDYWVTHALWALHAQGFEVWFKGGTSLSKGFGLLCCSRSAQRVSRLRRTDWF